MQALARRKNYKLEVALSIICIKWFTTSHYISEPIGPLLIYSLIIYPYLIYKLKCILRHRYSYSKVNLAFSITILALIINAISFLGVSTFNIISLQRNYQYIYFTFVNITTMIKSIAFIILGTLLSKNYFEFKISLKVFAISQVVFGVETVFFTVLEVSRVMNLYSFDYSEVVREFMNYSNLILQIMIFVSLAIIFINAGALREKSSANDIAAN
jgi:hypothetical protein